MCEYYCKKPEKKFKSPGAAGRDISFCAVAKNFLPEKVVLKYENTIAERPKPKVFVINNS